MSYVILLVSTAAGIATTFDGKYVRAYDPSYCHPGGYDGGILEVAANRAEAMRFPTMQAAMDKYLEPFGLREDGEPNRPLSAWTIEVLPDKEAAV